MYNGICIPEKASYDDKRPAIYGALRSCFKANDVFRSTRMAHLFGWNGGGALIPSKASLGLPLLLPDDFDSWLLTFFGRSSGPSFCGSIIKYLLHA